MPNFEDDHKKPEEGYVVLPVSAYNELLSRLHLLEEHLITVSRAPYDDSIELVIDKVLAHELAVKQLSKVLRQGDGSKYAVKSPEDLLLFGATIAELKPVEVEESEDDND